MGYNTVSITIKPYVEPLIPIDPTRVCILINGNQDVGVFAVNSYDYSRQLSASIVDPDDLAAAKDACAKFFSIAQGKKDAVVAVYNSKLDILETTDDYLSFSWVVLNGMRTDWGNFDDILQKATGNSQFLVVNEESGVAPVAPTGSDFLIQISNPTQIALEVVSFLTSGLANDPSFDCSITITGSSIQGSNYTTGVYNQLVAAGCNFYTSVGGVMSFEAGVVNAKTKIERVFFRNMYLPTYVMKEIAIWRSTTVIRENDIPLVRGFFTGILMRLVNQNHLKSSELLNNSPFSIDNIEVKTDANSGTKSMQVYFRYSFNNNIDQFMVNIGEVK